MAITTSEVTKSLRAAKATWQAAESAVSKLSSDAQRSLLGVVPSAEVTGLMAAMKAAAPAAITPAFAPAVDWRNKNGNHITAVENQGGCGSCVSFGTVALVEAMANIQTGKWLDLSEADSHFCSSHGANCGGWSPDQCIDQIISRGVCDAADFPYADAFPNHDIWSGPPQCHLAPDRNQRAVKVGSRITLSDPTSVKNYLTSTGPVVGCFTVYDDFFSYSNGVYHHVTGGVAGGHCVLVIGFDESQQCWIIKNSWDVTWGIGGFCLISYADFLYNGQFFPMYGVANVKIPSTGWQSLAGSLTTAPAAGRNQDGRLEIFARGVDNALWHIWQVAPNGAWSGWSSLGGILTSAPYVIANADGRLEVFARGTDNAVWHTWQTKPNNGWSGWASLGGIITSPPIVGRNKDGRLEVFARGTDGALWHIWQTAPNNGWSGWASLGTHFNGTPTVTNNADGRLEVFMLGPNNSLIHQWQTAPNNGWSSWASQGGVLTSLISASINKDGRLEVFARGKDNALWHIWQTAPNSGWSSWASLGGIITTDPIATHDADGRLEVFARGTDGALWHIWQTAPNSGWSGWASLGGLVSADPAIGANKDGRLEVLVRGTDNALWHRWQTAPSNGWN